MEIYSKWMVYSACTSHMCNYRMIFEEFKPKIGSVQVGDKTAYNRKAPVLLLFERGLCNFSCNKI